MSDPTPPAFSSLTVAVSLGSEGYEAAHVHEVYQHIAPHFSATRFKVCRLEPNHTVFFTICA
jgi:tRNA (uracil-5-)-methyltransferase TRM9